MKISGKTPMRFPPLPTKTLVSAAQQKQNSGSGGRLQNQPKDPVQVFCRIRPLQSDADLSCVRVIEPKTVVLTPPEIAVNYKLNCNKETEYLFANVFGSESRQSQIYKSVGQPLVENLIRGNNGLLFTYGVTGSGKTYTMTGDIRKQGIMPRCLDSLFRTITDYQTKKFVFKPDKLNGFEILSDADAMLERQADMNSRFAKPRRKDSDPEIASQASAEASPLGGIMEDNMYAVFVTYIEIYNNSVYDLLEDTGFQKTLQSKIIREDAHHNMYVHGVTEIEIKSVEEAIEIFQIGQKRKRMGHTILNAESSRSHSVFTVRLVQAPSDSQGEDILHDKETVCVSQLSLVDLAGSERTNRTKNTGQRLREAGNINNSLMTLRTCLEYLRENQLTCANKKVPYRDSKLTHLFKNYFDGEGQVSMIVCINPRAEDYDETAQVMKFAEMTQEVQIPRQTPMKVVPGLTPGRRKANKIFKSAVANLNDLGISDEKDIDIDIGLVYNLDGSNFPNIKLGSPESNSIIVNLMMYLEQRIQKRSILKTDLQMRCTGFRMHLLQMEKENICLKAELQAIKAAYSQEQQKTNQIGKKIIIHESSIDELNRKLRERNDENKKLQKLLNERTYLLDQKEFEKEKQKKKFNMKLAVEKDKMKSELDMKMNEQRNQLENRIKNESEKLRLVENIINTDNISTPQVIKSNNLKVSTPLKPAIAPRLVTHQHISRTPKGVPVVNIRHRRSKSTDGKWLEHRAPNPVPVGTILQPYLKNRKSITKLTDIKDLINQKTSKYCLVSQEADTDGELETKLYKGNVIPTCAGGAQVIFNDVECLKQKSPVPSPQRKRRSNSVGTGREILAHDVAARCTISVEGHSSKRQKF